MSFQPLLEKIYSEKTRHSKHYLASMTNNSVYDNNAGNSFYVRYWIRTEWEDSVQMASLY